MNKKYWWLEWLPPTIACYKAQVAETLNYLPPTQTTKVTTSQPKMCTSHTLVIHYRKYIYQSPYCHHQPYFVYFNLVHYYPGVRAVIIQYKATYAQHGGATVQTVQYSDSQCAVHLYTQPTPRQPLRKLLNLFLIRYLRRPSRSLSTLVLLITKTFKSLLVWDNTGCIKK